MNKIINKIIKYYKGGYRETVLYEPWKAEYDRSLDIDDLFYKIGVDMKAIHSSYPFHLISDFDYLTLDMFHKRRGPLTFDKANPFVTCEGIPKTSYHYTGMTNVLEGHNFSIWFPDYFKKDLEKDPILIIKYSGINKLKKNKISLLLEE